jgi:DNA polymerase sigma
MKLYGEYTVDAKLFGSSAAGLALPTSDIDILLTGFSLETQEEGAGLLQHLAERLRRMRWVGSCETYLHAKVPIIKLEVEPLVDFLEVRGGDWEGLEGLRQVKEVMNLGKKMEEGLRVKVDITVEVKKAEYSHLGCMSTDFMKRWLDIIPNLNPILLILKYLLSARGLNRPYKGGLSSYCLMIMVGAYLK